jgi:hypothetical protein
MASVKFVLRVIFALVVGTLAFHVRNASADPIVYTTFADQGSWALVDNGPSGGFESISLYFKPTGYTDIPPAGTVDSIHSVAVKVSSSLGTGGSLTAHPAGTWTFQLGGLSNGGCNGSDDGFACAKDGVSALVTSSLYWTFLLNLDGNPLLTGTRQASIKAEFNNTLDTQGNLLSEDITLQRIISVPDGGATVTLLGAALFGLGLLRRRSRRNT